MPGINSIRDLSPGDLYTQTGRDVYELVAICERPTLVMRNIVTGDEIRGAYDGPNFGKMIRLIPSEAVTAQPLGCVDHTQESGGAP